MRNTPDLYDYGTIIKAEHTECTVPLEFRYNGVYGYPKEDIVEYWNLLQPMSFAEMTDVILLDMIRLFGKREVALLALSVNEYRLFTVVFSKIYSPIVTSKGYDSYFAPFYGKGNWLVYGNSRNNLERAITRLTNCRMNEEQLERNHNSLSIDQIMRGGRRRWRVFHSVLLNLRSRVHARLNMLDHSLIERVKHAFAPHQKKRIRVQALKELIDRSDTGLFMTSVRGKLKLFEKAKANKQPRLIGDYTCPGSLLGGFLAEVTKECFEPDVELDNFTTKYVSSIEPSVLDSLGEKLKLDNKDQFYFFSDDSILKMNGSLYEIDISSCDISNRSPIFGILLWLYSGTQFHELAAQTIAQCETPVKLTDPQNKHNKITLQGVRPIEYSGSVLTTLLNNIASLCIGLSIYVNRCNTVDEVIRAAIAIGYNITCSLKHNFEQLTFLKHSWYDDQSGHLRSFLNLGAILRSFGTFTGDLPGSKKDSIELRCQDFCASVIKGYVHSGTTSILSSLQQKYTYHTGKYDRFVDNKHYSIGKRGSIPDVALIRRYGCTHPQIDMLNLLIKKRAMFQHISCEMLDIIYRVDYGLNA